MTVSTELQIIWRQRLALRAGEKIWAKVYFIFTIIVSFPNDSSTLLGRVLNSQGSNRVNGSSLSSGSSCTKIIFSTTKTKKDVMPSYSVCFFIMITCMKWWKWHRGNNTWLVGALYFFGVKAFIFKTHVSLLICCNLCHWRVVIG